MAGKLIAATVLGPDHTRHFWPECEEAADAWADEHIILVDESGDLFGNEWKWRRQLWDKATAIAEEGDWIFVLDSDFILTFDPHDLVDSDASAWKFVLYDLWDEKHFRDDVFWKAHKFPRPWMFAAKSAPVEPRWNEAGIHVGHVPLNFPLKGADVAEAPWRHAILHLGWMTPEVRREKFDRYMRVADQLNDWQKKHVSSVLDKNPRLERMPSEFDEWLRF